MIQTISISDLQKSTKKPFQNKGITWVLKNNQIHGGIFNQNFAKFLNEEGITEMFEDWLWANDKALQKLSIKASKMSQENNYDKTLDFNQVFDD